MVTLQILVLPFLVRVRVAQQNRRRKCASYYFLRATRTRTRKGRTKGPFFSLLRKRAPFHSAWRPSGTAVSFVASLAPIRLHLRFPVRDPNPHKVSSWLHPRCTKVSSCTSQGIKRFPVVPSKTESRQRSPSDPVLPGLEGRQSGMDRSEMKRVWGVAAPN